MNDKLAGSARKHILTINVEGYFQVGAFSQLIPFDHWERFDTRIKRNTDAALALLADTENRATFFASGWIGENYPQILRDIIEHGHEVACHGYYHQSIREIPPPAFREDLRRSRQAIEQATGRAILGFRIGRGWIGPDDLWALDVLCEEGFRYDSSLCPIGRQFSKNENRFFLHLHNCAAGDLWEVPASATGKFGWAVPFSGGNYIRQLPAWPIREAVARWVERRRGPLVMYFHVWELDPEQPNISAASWLQHIRHYRNLASMPKRVRYFLERYPFTTISDYLNLGEGSIGEPRPAMADAQPTIPVATTPSFGSQVPLAIVIPCYNEEASLEYLRKTLANFSTASARSLRPQFVFVDDGSSDSTWCKLESLFGTRADCTLIQHGKNEGIAAAILTGIKQATTELVAVVDADCTFDPMQLNKMVPMMTDEVAVVAASPFHSRGTIANVPRWRLLLSKGAAFLYRCVLHHQFSSYTSCFRVYRRSAVSDLAVYKKGFCGVAEILARLDLAGYRLVECPAELEIRLLGRSKINTMKTIIDHLQLILRLAAARWLRVPLPDGYRP